MAVDKTASPAWVRITIIVVILAFVGISVPVVLLGARGGSGSSDGSSKTANTDSITAEYQPRVDAAVAAAKSSPDNPDVVAQVGHAYFEWAAALYEGGQQSAAVPIWKSAVSYYDQVLKLRPDDDVVLGNKAFALAYANDPGAAVALQAFIDGASDNSTLSEQVANAKSLLAQIKAAAESTSTP